MTTRTIVGLCLPQANGLRVAFPDGQGGIRWVLSSRLDAVESVFAMTVHKSQGRSLTMLAWCCRTGLWQF